MKVCNNCFPSLSDKYLCGDLLGSQLSLGHKCSHLNQLQDRGLQPRNAPSPILPCLRRMTFTTRAIFFPLIKLTKQVLQDVLISISRCLPAPWHSRGSRVARRAVQLVAVSAAGGFVPVMCWHWRYQWFGFSMEWHFQAGGILAICSQARWFQGGKSGVWADALARTHYLLAPWAQHHPPWYSLQVKKHDIKKLQLFTFYSFSLLKCIFRWICLIKKKSYLDVFAWCMNQLMCQA